MKAFWSLTMYEASGFFVSNPLERYALGNRSQVHYNEDGSLNVYMQSRRTHNEQQKENWLPAPAGEFHVVIRLYATEPQDIEPILEGTGSWQTPLIEPCLKAASRRAVRNARAGRGPPADGQRADGLRRARAGATTAWPTLRI